MLAFANLSAETALRCVILQKVGEHLGACEVVDSDYFVTFRVKHLAESQTANAAETIDSNSNVCHIASPKKNSLPYNIAFLRTLRNT